MPAKSCQEEDEGSLQASCEAWSWSCFRPFSNMPIMASFDLPF